MKILSKSALEKIATIQDASVIRLENLLKQPGYESGARRERVEKNLAKTKEFQTAAHHLASLAMPSGRMQNVFLSKSESEIMALYADMADSEV